MRYAHPAIKRFDIGALVVLALLLGILTPLFINHNSLKTSEELTSVNDHLQLIEAVADECSEEPVEELPELRRRLCTFPDAEAFVWIFNDTFSEEQKHTVCSSRGGWAIIQTGDDFDFCLTNLRPRPNNSNLNSIGRQVFEVNNQPQLQLVYYPEGSQTPRNSHTFEPAGGWDILIFMAFITTFCAIPWIIIRIFLKKSCQYRTMKAGIRARLRQGLPNNFAEKVFVSVEGWWHNPLIHGTQTEALTVGSPVTLYITAKSLLFTADGSNHEIAFPNITAWDFDIYIWDIYPTLDIADDGGAIVSHDSMQVFSQPNERQDNFIQLLFRSNVDRFYWQIMPDLIAKKGDLTHLTYLSDNDIDQLLKPYRYKIARMAYAPQPKPDLQSGSSADADRQNDY